MSELEMMRQELQALKDKVNSQGVLNERLVRKSVKDKMSDIHRAVFKMAILVILVIPVWLLIKYQNHLSWPLTIFTILMLVVSVFFDWYINRMDVSTMDSDLRETACKLVEMKKRRVLQEKIGCFAVLPLWLVWLGYEFYHNTPDPDTALPMLIGMGAGGVIGGIIGLRIFFKWQRKNDEMIEQINELMEE